MPGEAFPEPGVQPAGYQPQKVLAENGTPEYWAARARGVQVVDPHVHEQEERERERTRTEVHESLDRLFETVIAKAQEVDATEYLGVRPALTAEEVLEEIRKYATEPVRVSSGNEFGRGYNRGRSTALANILRIIEGHHGRPRDPHP